MLNRLIAVLLLGVTLPAVAGEHFQWHPSSQWKYLTTSTLFDLVHAGYTIVAVENSFFSTDESLEVFFLQKGKSVRKCIEYHKHDVKDSSRDVDSGFYCFELVQTNYVD